MGGHEVGRRLREVADNRALLIVALTGWAQESHAQASKDAGFDAHYVKPIDPSKLLANLQSIAVGRTTGQ
jgi:CheY-like chemotaxis protein